MFDALVDFLEFWPDFMGDFFVFMRDPQILQDNIMIFNKLFYRELFTFPTELSTSKKPTHFNTFNDNLHLIDKRPIEFDLPIIIAF